MRMKLRVGVSTVVAMIVLGTASPGLAATRAQRAAVAKVSALGYRAHPASFWITDSGLNVLIGTLKRSGDGYDQRAFFFVNGRYIGTDASGSSRQVGEVWQTEDTVALMYVLYRRNDPNCCPTGGGKIVRFHWTGRRLVALDRIPPLTGEGSLSR
jgi:hypothetical protein